MKRVKKNWYFILLIVFLGIWLFESVKIIVFGVYFLGILSLVLDVILIYMIITNHRNLKLFLRLIFVLAILSSGSRLFKYGVKSESRNNGRADEAAVGLVISGVLLLGSGKNISN